MKEYTDQNQLLTYRKRLKSFSQLNANIEPELKLRQIQEDMVVLAGWGNNPEISQIDAELRKMYSDIKISAASTAVIPDTSKNSIITENQISAMPSRKAGRISPGNVILGFVLWFGVSVIGIAIAFGFNDSAGDLVTGLIWSAGNIIGLFGFFKIVAPGVKIIMWLPPESPEKPLAGTWLGIIGGLGWSFGLTPISLGLILFFPEAVGFVFLSSLLILPAIGISAGKSIAHQPLNKSQREQ